MRDPQAFYLCWSEMKSIEMCMASKGALDDIAPIRYIRKIIIELLIRFELPEPIRQAYPYL